MAELVTAEQVRHARMKCTMMADGRDFYLHVYRSVDLPELTKHCRGPRGRHSTERHSTTLKVGNVVADMSAKAIADEINRQRARAAAQQKEDA